MQKQTSPSQVVSRALPEQALATLGQHPLLRGLLAVGAGFGKGAADPLQCAREGGRRAVFLYCARGSGWCEGSARLHNVRRGDLLIIPPGASKVCRARASDPWTIHWSSATGSLLPHYFEALDCADGARVLHIGDAPEVVRLFHEILLSLEQGTALPEVVRASHTLAHLLAIVIGTRYRREIPDRNTTEKVGEAIVYMSEHLDKPVPVSALSRLASLSPGYFSSLFKEQTGCAPREYLHLLRIHRACQLLNSTELSIKQVAAKVGYPDPLHFSRRFKEFHGVSPTQYRGSRGIGDSSIAKAD